MQGIPVLLLLLLLLLLLRAITNSKPTSMHPMTLQLWQVYTSCSLCVPW